MAMLTTIPDTGLIIAAATGYRLAVIAPFVRSALQRTRADVLLLIEPGQRDIELAFRGEPRLHALRVRPKNNAHEVVVDRFIMFLELLGRLNVADPSPSGRAAPVMLSDSRDVIFQADPFAHPACEALILAEESRRIQDCIDNRTWMQDLFGKRALAQIKDRPILCAGTMLGPASMILTLLKHLCALMKERQQVCQATPWGLDQAALNTLIHGTGLDLPVIMEGCAQGRFLTVHHEREFRIDSAGRLRNQANQIFAVIHQHDRLPWLEQHLKGQLLTL